MATNSIVPIPNSDNSNLTNLERRKQARLEMVKYAGAGKFMRLLHSPFIRKGILPSGLLGHSVIDLVNILSDTEQEPRQFWNDTKKRITRDDPQLSDRIRQLKFRNWSDGKMRLSDALDAGDLVIVIFELHTPSSNELRNKIADVFRRYDNQFNSRIISELENNQGWAATRNKLDMIEAGLTDIPNSELQWWQK